MCSGVGSMLQPLMHPDGQADSWRHWFVPVSKTQASGQVEGPAQGVAGGAPGDQRREIQDRQRYGHD